MRDGAEPPARYGELGSIAWHNWNSGGQTHDVMTKAANPYGLYDMLGNVWEWTGSWYKEGSTRVLRGGSCYSISGDTRVSVRDYVPVGRSDDIGFRCAGDSL